ncbi:MAG: hypothetical protein PHP98_08080 [Kiritimatiellae bacterium]|nr:hypothetical protein [Kiritimatiellia bacterium]
MEQKQRNIIAWILLAVSLPLLIYLLATSIPGIRKRPAAPAAGQISAASAEIPSPIATIQPAAAPEPPIDPKISAEQRRIAMLLPENNPFGSARSSVAAPPEISDEPVLPAAPAPDIKLTAIVSRGSASRAAMINGRLIGEGERIANWTVIKVTEREVLLKDGGRQMILRLK